MINLFLSGLSGLLLPLAFAPFNFFILGWICPAILLYVWYKAQPRQAFLSGFLFGAGFFGAGVYWIYISIHTYGEAPMLLSFFLTMMFIACLALFPAVQGYLLRRFFSGSQLLILFPATWVLFEIIRSHLFTGFPWLLLGYSQIDTRLSHLAPFLSVYGISFVTAIFSSLLAGLIVLVVHLKKSPHSEPIIRGKEKSTPFILLAVLILFWCLLRMPLSYFYEISSSGGPLSVSLVQGNISQSLKWQPEQVKKTLLIYEKLTQAHWKSDLIIWPEAALTLTQNEAKPYLEKMEHLAKANNSSIILGLPIVKRKDENVVYYNGLLVLGQGEGTYLKRHLVPFGEFFPFRSRLNWLFDRMNIPMSDMASGDEQQALLNVDGVKIAASICYEIAYPFLIARDLPEAQLLITLTDDSWFGDSIAQAQHLQIARMRALEVGRYLLMSTNDGITAIIDHEGKIVKQARPFDRSVLSGEVQLKKGSTPFVRWRFYPIGLIILLNFLIIMFVKQSDKKKKQNKLLGKTHKPRFL